MKHLVFPLLLIFLLVASLGGVFFWFGLNTKPFSQALDLQEFVVPKGLSAVSIGDKLEKEGFIRSAFAFKFLVQLSGKSNSIKAGQFTLSPSFTTTQIIDELTKEPSGVWVTIQEGLRREEIAVKFAKNLKKSDEDQGLFIQEFLSLSKGEEGFLFPDTYLLPKATTAPAALKILKTTFERRVDQRLQADASLSGLSLAEVITLASIIERETKTDSERPVVSGILLNRLKIGMALQTDATVQYAAAGVRCKVQGAKCQWWQPVSREDLEINSSYNTYKFSGLPPGPIASPGLSSIKAAVYPESSDYLYYLHDREGKVYYAKTLEEHNENVRRYLK